MRFRQIPPMLAGIMSGYVIIKVKSSESAGNHDQNIRKAL